METELVELSVVVTFQINQPFGVMGNFTLKFTTFNFVKNVIIRNVDAFIS